jgi:hypothetical protein
MKNTQTMKLISIVSLVIFASASLIVSPSAALLTQNSTSWYSTSDTNSVAVAIRDVDGDGLNEIVSAGYYNDGTYWNGQLVVMNSVTMAVEASTVWRLGSITQVTALAIGDVDGDGQVEIVTGGTFFDGTYWTGQLIVWNGLTLATKQLNNFRLGQYTVLNAIAIADLTPALGQEIITGSTTYDGTYYNGHLAIWNGATLALEQQTFWRLGTKTFVTSVGVVTVGTAVDIVTGGEIFDGTYTNAQIILWNSANLAFIGLNNWRLGTADYCNAITIADVIPGGSAEIVTAGNYFDGSGYVGQLIVWDAATLTSQKLAHWKNGVSTTTNSLCDGILSGTTLDIETAGTYSDGTRMYAQVIDWNIATMTSNSVASWFTTSNTSGNSVAIGTILGFGTRVIESGQYWDNIRGQAQVVTLG